MGLQLNFYVIVFIKLLVGHCLADYPLQGDFLSKAKNHRQPIPGVPYYQALLAHSIIQAGMVYYITGWMPFALAEGALHYLIDYWKCDGRISFNTDQVLHVSCKAIFVAGLYAAS